MSERTRVQRKKTGDGERDVAPPIVHEALRSGGEPLDDATRAFMEPRFGYEFGGVRVHTDETAAQSAEAVNARAYTIGRDIVFGAGRYQPGTDAGRRLLAHELTHVVQHSRSEYVSNSPLSVSSPRDSAEHTARVASKQVGAGLTVHLSSTTLNVARQEEDDEHSWWDTFVEGASGLAYGTVQGLAPGGFLAPSPNPKSKTFEFFRGAGQIATGITETIGGIGGEVGGLALDATGLGALLGVPINIASAAVIANGVAGATAGFGTIMHSMSMNDNSGPYTRRTDKNGNEEVIWTEPQTREEQLAMEEARNGGGDDTGMESFDDPKYKDNPAWRKYQVVHRTSDGNQIVIHYMKNTQTGATEQFKFISRGRVPKPTVDPTVSPGDRP